MQKQALLAVLAATLLIASACAEPEPEIVEVTREVSVPQTVEVPRTVEVTREVTTIVQEVVEATVEVTRIERVVVTASPPPTPTSSPIAPTPLPTANVASQLLVAMRGTRSDLEELGGVIDTAVRTGVISCQRTVDLHNTIVNAPMLDTSASTDAAASASDRYALAVEVYAEGGGALAEQCRNAMEGQGKNQIPAQTWTRARKGVNDALGILIPAIETLE